MQPRLKRKPPLQFLALLFLAAFVFPSLSRATVFDWNTETWTGGGPARGSSITQNYDLNGDSVNDVAITISSSASNAGNFAWNYLTSGNNTQNVNYLTGGGSTSQNALQLYVNKGNSAGVTVTIKFTTAVTGVSFSLYDVDYSSGTFRDQISNITALTSGSATIGASTVTTGLTNTSTGSGVGLVAFGTSSSATTSSDGNVFISFGTNAVKQVTFTWINGDPALSTQQIALSNISFTPLPEVGSSVAALALCGGAVGFQVVRNRRRRKK